MAAIRPGSQPRKVGFSYTYFLCQFAPAATLSPVTSAVIDCKVLWRGRLRWSAWGDALLREVREYRVAGGQPGLFKFCLLGGIHFSRERLAGDFVLNWASHRGHRDVAYAAVKEASPQIVARLGAGGGVVVQIDLQKKR